MSGEAFCAAAANDPAVVTQEGAAAYCADRNQNAASQISTFLDKVGPKLSPSGNFALGYTLTMPLLGYYRRAPSGAWVLDRHAIDVAVRTVHDVDRKVVVYLSANHFTDGGIDLSDELGRDAANLMWTRGGPLTSDKYFTVAVHAWTLVDMDAPITRMRQQAFAAAVDAICKLDARSRSRIAGVSVLGEVHQLFGGFPSSEGYDAGFNITDYAPKAVQGFRGYLRTKFGTVDKLNTWAGAAFTDFDKIDPPARDIRHDTLRTFFDHIDAYAAGVVPIQGWAFDPAGGTPRIAIYLDGQLKGTVAANLNRTDVAEATHKVTRQNVGWRYNLDYRAEKPGVHTLEVFLAEPGQRLKRLSKRGLTVVPRDQSPATPVPSAMVDADDADPQSPILSYMDGPAPLTPLFYNPLAQLWLEYRNKVVADYIGSFAAIADKSCLPHDVIFSHQILPELNSSWDGDLLAVDASQHPNPAYNQGTTLYGGAAYGQSFFDWAKAEGWTGYAVSEMNPRFALAPQQFIDMFEAHRAAGARYLAPYFMSITPARVAPPAGSGLNQILISPDNTMLGSNLFYQGIVDLMRHH